MYYLRKSSGGAFIKSPYQLLTCLLYCLLFPLFSSPPPSFPIDARLASLEVQPPKLKWEVDLGLSYC
jgi:hypothetical protein